MAGETKEDKQEKKLETKTEAKSETDKGTPAKGKGLFLWLILGIVILGGGAGGFAISQLMGGSAPADPNAVLEKKPAAAPKSEKAEKSGGHGGGGGEKSEGGSKTPEPGQSWMYDKLDAVVANLNEPGVTRYVRVTVILEISGEVDYAETLVFLDEKKIVLQDWLTTYLAGLSLEDVRGSRSLNRIKQDVLDQFNQLLFGPDKASIEKILFKEFAVQ
jgi:flagellar FliL protein